MGFDEVLCWVRQGEGYGKESEGGGWEVDETTVREVPDRGGEDRSDVIFRLGFEVEVEVLKAWETEGVSKSGGGRDEGGLKVENGVVSAQIDSKNSGSSFRSSCTCQKRLTGTKNECSISRLLISTSR